MASIQFDDFPELAAARKLWDGGQTERARQAFEHAIHCQPLNVRALVEFARANGQRHEIAEAERLLDHALEIAVGHTQAEIVIAQALRSIFRQKRAIRLFERLWDHNKLPPPVVAELAVLYEQLGDYVKASIAHEYKILDRMRRLLPDQWIECSYEDLVADLHSVGDQVVTELGLPTSPTTRSYLEKTSRKIVNSPTRAEVRKPVHAHRVGRWANYASYLSHLPFPQTVSSRTRRDS